MILRRLTQSLKEQNWTAIAIEFVLLVAGVFLGIQAADWNEAKADRRIVDKYLADIAADGPNSIPLHSMFVIPVQFKLVIPGQFKLVIPAKAGIQFLNLLPR